MSMLVLWRLRAGLIERAVAVQQVHGGRLERRHLVDAVSGAWGVLRWRGPHQVRRLGEEKGLTCRDRATSGVHSRLTGCLRATCWAHAALTFKLMPQVVAVEQPHPRVVRLHTLEVNAAKVLSSRPLKDTFPFNSSAHIRA